MKKVVKVKGIVSRPLRQRYLYAPEAERAALKPVVDEESRWMIERMAARGYRLEATVSDVLGIFTRGPAAGALKPLEQRDPAVSTVPEAEPAGKALS